MKKGEPGPAGKFLRDWGASSVGDSLDVEKSWVNSRSTSANLLVTCTSPEDTVSCFAMLREQFATNT